MPAYLCTLNRTRGGHTTKNGADAMVVFAATTAKALQVADSFYGGDGGRFVADGTATEIAAAANWIGWTFKVNISGGLAAGAGVNADGSADVVLTATGAAQDTIDEIAAVLVTALNALPTIANASYDAGTQTLTAAGAADNLGDKKLTVQIIPPNGNSSCAAFVGAIVNQGAANAALTVVLPADADTVPSVAVPLIQV